jgi:hypothetical protein
MSRPIRQQHIRTQITGLLANGETPLTHKQVAAVVGVSTKTVQRVARQVSPDLEAVEEKLAEYRRLLHERLPVSERVERYVEIARGKANPFAAMRALERIDRLDGIEVDETEDREPAVHQPLFVLPPGSELRLVAQMTSPCQPHAEQT